MQDVSRFDIPEDLIALRRAFVAAGECCRELGEQLPTGQDIIDGRTADQALSERFAQARAEQRRIAVEIHRHRWWATADNRYEADRAVRQAADSMHS